MITQTDTNFKELISGSSIALLFKITGMALGYLFTILITRYYGANIMGIFALSLTILEIFAIAGKLGLENASLRFMAEYSSQNKVESIKSFYLKIIKIIIPLSLLLSLLLFLVSGFIAEKIFHKGYLTTHFRIISFALLPLVLTSINIESLRGLKKIREYAFLQNIPINLLSTLILLGSLLFIKSNKIPLLSYLISVFFVCLISLIFWIKNSGYSRISRGTMIYVKSILTVSLPMLMSSSLFFIMGWTDTVMLGIYRTEEEIGIYNVAMKISVLASVVLYAVNSIAAPKFAELYGKRDIKSLGQIARRSTKLIVWCSCPILAILFLFPTVVLGFFGEEFKAGMYALVILTFGQFINAVSGSVGYILQMTDKQKIFQNIVLIAALLNILLNTLLIPRYGLNGAAFASMLSMVFWNLYSVRYIRSNLHINTIYIPGLVK